MSKLHQKILKIINAALILSALGLVLWLANLNFPRSGQIVITAALGKDLPAFTRLGPDVRLKMENGWQAVLENPVYFDLRSLPWFIRARVYLTYRENGRRLEGLGGQTGPGWQYEVKKPLAVSNLADGIKQAIFDFDLAKLYSPKNVRRFLIATEQTPGGELKIKELKIILSR